MLWRASRRYNEDLSQRFVAWSEADGGAAAATTTLEPIAETAPESSPETKNTAPVRDKPGDLTAARKAARERYAAIAAALKAEAGVTKHYQHKMLGGLAWSDQGKILAPEGVTRRQLYVLAHECGHVVLHGTPETWNRPGHVKEHEAETYAHRAFARYGIEVPVKSAHWARAYVGQWIMKDKLAGIAISPEAVEFALGRRSPHDPLPNVDGQPPQDFSKHLDRFTAKGVRLVERLERQAQDPIVTQEAVPPAELDVDEFTLKYEVTQLARKLDKNGVRGAFSKLADITEQVNRVKRADGSAVPTLMRALDQLRELERSHKSMRADRLQKAFREREGSTSVLLISGLLAAGLLLSALYSGSSEALYVAAFFVVAAVISLVSIALSFWSDH